MIQREDLVKIGQFKKPHGIRGEISFSFTNDSFDKSEQPFLLCELEGIFVPFLLEEYRFTSDSTALVKLKNIDSEEKAKRISHKEVYFPKEEMMEKTIDESFTWDYFIGYTLIDKHSGEIGLISDVDESTINTLFIIQKGEAEILIPATGEWITGKSDAKKELYVELPEGVLEL
jgi:16S rRNA processing protein RimM